MAHVQAVFTSCTRVGVGEFARLRAEQEKVLGTLAKLRIEHQAIKDELARYKKLPPRPPQKPSGMDKATDRPEVAAGGAKGERSTRRRVERSPFTPPAAVLG